MPHCSESTPVPESYVSQQLVFPQHEDEDILGKQRDSNVSSVSLQRAGLERGSCSVDSAGDITDAAGQESQQLALATKPAQSCWPPS